MMTCQLCGDTNGPWEFADVYDDGRSKVMLICEDCAKEIRKLERRMKKNETTNIRNKRHASGVSRTNSGSE